MSSLRRMREPPLTVQNTPFSHTSPRLTAYFLSSATDDTSLPKTSYVRMIDIMYLIIFFAHHRIFSTWVTYLKFSSLYIKDMLNQERLAKRLRGYREYHFKIPREDKEVHCPLSLETFYTYTPINRDVIKIISEYCDERAECFLQNMFLD